MTHSPTPTELLALRTANAALLNSPDVYTDFASTIVFALGSAQLLQSPETAAELSRLRAWVAELETAPAAVLYLAEYDSVETTVHSTLDGARACCDDITAAVGNGKPWDWSRNEDGVYVQFWTYADNDRALHDTGGTVTEVRVQLPESAHAVEPVKSPADELSLLRARVSELEAAQAAFLLPWAHRLDAKSLDNFVGDLVRAAESPLLFVVDEIHETVAHWRGLVASRPSAGELAEQRHLMDPLDHALERLATRSAAVEDPHDSPLHHSYTKGRDLPEVPSV